MAASRIIHRLPENLPYFRHNQGSISTLSETANQVALTGCKAKELPVMARMGKRERLQRREVFQFIKGHVQATVAFNLSQPKPERSYLSRDETAVLMGNTHTSGFTLGQRRTTFQKPGTFKNK